MFYAKRRELLVLEPVEQTKVEIGIYPPDTGDALSLDGQFQSNPLPDLDFPGQGVQSHWLPCSRLGGRQDHFARFLPPRLRSIRFTGSPLDGCGMVRVSSGSLCLFGQAFPQRP